MKHVIKTITMYLCMAVIFSGLLLSGCGSSSGGGGKKTDETSLWYQDNDRDGFGNVGISMEAVEEPDGYVANANDCNDADPDTSPMTKETMGDGIDNNCNTLIDETFLVLFPDTGQSGDYTEIFGEDSDFTSEPPSYTKLDVNHQELDDSAIQWAMVKDDVTGLIWEVKNSGDPGDPVENPGNLQDVDNLYTWNEAHGFITKMNEAAYGGYDNWRLPTVRELCYLANGDIFSEAFPSQYFYYDESLSIWSGTPIVPASNEDEKEDVTTEKAWYVSTIKGLPSYGSVDGEEGRHSVWAVREETENTSSYMEFDADIMLDTTTGLMWQRSTAGYDAEDEEQTYLMTFDEAIEYCDNLKLGGFEDWRLPNRNELIALLQFDAKDGDPALDQGDSEKDDDSFINTLTAYYWSSTTFVTSSTHQDSAWAAKFLSPGAVTYRKKTLTAAVRAVRGGNNSAERIWYRDIDGDIYGNPNEFIKRDSTLPALDGYVTRDGDCDDSNPSINPAAIEIPDDEVDQNCDGVIDVSINTWYYDGDGDGFGTPDQTTRDEEKPDGYADNNTDCDDSDEDVYPGAREILNDKDDDCNGLKMMIWYRDGDGDGYGTSLKTTKSETKPVGYTDNADDCDDSSASVHPDAEDLVNNGVDDDCDGLPMITWYHDGDGDGFGASDDTMDAEGQPAGYVADNGDCNDSLDSIHPDAIDVLDNDADDDCDGLPMVTWYYDGDNDGYGTSDKMTVAEEKPTGFVDNYLDCDDTSASVHPDAEDLLNNDTDDDCDGLEYITWYRDSDGDGFGITDGTPDDRTDAEEQPDGFVDNDSDCNDSDSEIRPDTWEIAGDITDNDCNDRTDEPPLFPDTGQTRSYTETFGEDADFLINPPTYEKLDADGKGLDDDAASWIMVRDKVTGLVWEVKTFSDGTPNASNVNDADNTFTWEEASSEFIDTLNQDNFGGENDWRLPTAKELSNLANSSLATLAFPSDFFDLSSNVVIWSSTPDASDSTQAWAVSTVRGIAARASKSTEYAAWAVRSDSGTVQQDLDELLPGIVKDKASGLMWQQVTATGNSGDGMTFEDALDYCDNLELGGYNDWRLPNRNELASLILYTENSPSINQEVFSDTLIGFYWTGTTYVLSDPTSAIYAWAVNFYTPRENFNTKTKKAWVRAVRGGNNTDTLTWYMDDDEDGYGDPAIFITLLSTLPQPDHYSADNTDCDDGNPAINPGAEDIPDSDKDEDCNGALSKTWYRDSDSDGYGDPDETAVADTQPDGYISFDPLQDCDDSNASVNPAMDELTDDGLDNDCNGLFSVSLYADGDEDGYGSGLRTFVQEVDLENMPLGSALNALDCDDSDVGIHPGRVEIEDDDTDSNCNGDNNDDSLKIIPDTGLTTVQTTLGGEDGDYSINPQSYTQYDITGNPPDPSDETSVAAVVVDNVTGLVWENQFHDDGTGTHTEKTYTWQEAVAHAEALSLSNYAGYNDWRLPTLIELAGIANLELADPENSIPAIDQNFFEYVKAQRYWTSTGVSGSGYGLTLNFRYGESSLQAKDFYHGVIAVRGDISDALINNGDGTVSEALSGLMWADETPLEDNWANSLMFAGSVPRAGYSDWRLPSENDILSLLTLLNKDASLDLSDYFLNALGAGGYWTSTRSESSQTQARTYSLDTKTTGTDYIVYSHGGMAVRGVQQSRFIDNGDGTVFDRKTGLMWQKSNGNSGATVSFENALNDCNSSETGGYDDWRLPNRNELLSLLEASMDAGSGFDDVFTDTGDMYWTSSCSGSPTVSGFAWQITFAEGETELSLGGVNNTNLFRAVRGGHIE